LINILLQSQERTHHNYYGYKCDILIHIEDTYTKAAAESSKGKRNKQRSFIMPTLLEALEEKYGGFGQTSDIEAEAELIVSIFVPKRPPRLR
jgi:hypothetical protein